MDAQLDKQMDEQTDRLAEQTKTETSRLTDGQITDCRRIQNNAVKARSI